MPPSSSDLVVDAQKNVSAEVSEQQQKVTTELKIQGETTVEGCSNLPPSLPIEVIERILKHTFRRRGKLTPSSDPFHLVGTSHLLLVSKGFRELCLPFFYYSVTISRPSHYVTFFNPEGSLFAGEEGIRRWSYVRELSIMLFIERPFKPSYDESGASAPTMVPLAAPPGHLLDVVCILEGGEATFDLKNDWGISKELFDMSSNLYQNQDLREQVFHRIRSEFEDELGRPASDDELAQWLADVRGTNINHQIQDRIRAMVVASIETERHAFYEELFGRHPPQVLRYPASIEAMIRQTYRDSFARPLPSDRTLLELYQSSPAQMTVAPPLFRRVVGSFTRRFAIRRVHLEGFQRAFLSDLGAYIQTHRHGLMDWTWKLEDGSLFFLSPPDENLA